MPVSFFFRDDLDEVDLDGAVEGGLAGMQGKDVLLLLLPGYREPEFQGQFRLAAALADACMLEPQGCVAARDLAFARSDLGFPRKGEAVETLRLAPPRLPELFPFAQVERINGLG